MTQSIRERKKEETRRRLVAAGREVFLEAGYHAASLDVVAGRAELTKGAVYSRFDNKADLFLAVLAEGIDRRIASLPRSLAAHGSAHDLAEALLASWQQTVASDERWLLLVLEFRVHAMRDPALRARYLAEHERLVHAFAAVLERSLAIDAEPADTRARLVLAMGVGVALEHASGALTDGATALAALRSIVDPPTPSDHAGGSS